MPRPKGSKNKAKQMERPEERPVQTTGRIDASLKELFLSEGKDDANVIRQVVRKNGAECACCGKPITETNGVFMPRGVFITGYHPICLPCQQRFYADTAQATSRTYALFYCCQGFNVPYKPSVIEEMTANQNGVWYEYVKRLQDGMTDDFASREAQTWTEGITDITEAFGGEFPVLPITGDVLVANMREMTDRDRWNIEWGEDRSDEDCRKADDRYMMMTANRGGGAVPPIVRMYLHDAILCMIDRDKQKDSMEAKRYQEMADKIMASDAVKNWMTGKQEEIRVDDIVAYMEAKGAMHNGFFLSYDEVVKVLSRQHGSYNMSLDIMDCQTMCIVNTMRKNEGESELTSLPVSAQVTDNRAELLSETSAEEKKILEGLQMKPPEREKS